MKRKTNKKIFYRVVLSLISLTIICGLVYTIGSCFLMIIDKYKEKSFLEKELIALKEKEKTLKVDAEKLQDSDYVARYAREKYLYSKDGEFIIRIPD